MTLACFQIGIMQIIGNWKYINVIESWTKQLCSTPTLNQACNIRMYVTPIKSEMNSVDVKFFFKLNEFRFL